MSRAISHDIFCTTEPPLASSTQIVCKPWRFPMSTVSASCPNLCLSSAVMQPFPSRDLACASASSLVLPAVRLSSRTLRRSVSDLAWWLRNKKHLYHCSVHDAHQLQRKASSSRAMANSQDSWVGSHKVQRVAHKDEAYSIPCGTNQQAHDRRDVTSAEITKTWSYNPMARVLCTGMKPSEAKYSCSESSVYERDGRYEIVCLDSDVEAEPQHGPAMPRALTRFQEHSPRSRSIEGLPFVTDQICLPLLTTPRLHGSVVSRSPVICEERTSGDNYPSLCPFSIVSTHVLMPSGRTTTLDTDRDVLPCSSMELPSDVSSSIPLRRSLIGRACSSFAAKHSHTHDLSHFTYDWEKQRPRSAVVHVRAGALREFERDEVLLNPDLVLRAAPQSPVSDVQSSNQSGKVFVPMSNPLGPNIFQNIRASYVVSSENIPQTQISSVPSSWRCSYSKVTKVNQGRHGSYMATEGKAATLRLLGTCTDALSKDVDSLPPTPSSAASVWSQDSAPNSAIFWNAMAREYVSDEDNGEKEDDLDLEFARMLIDPSSFRQLTMRDEDSWEDEDDELLGRAVADERNLQKRRESDSDVRSACGNIELDESDPDAREDC